MSPERLAEMEAFVRAYPHAPEDGNVSGEAATLRYLLAECVAEIGAYERTQKTLLRGLEDVSRLAKALGELQGLKVDPHPYGGGTMALRVEPGSRLRDWRLDTKG